MAIQVQFRRGSNSQHSTFTGADGEITVDTTNKTLRVHDGSTVGGIRIAKLSDITDSTIDLESISSNLIPSANVTYDIGTAEKSWRDLYLSGNTIYINNTQISTTSDNGVRFSDVNANNLVKITAASISVIEDSSFGNTTISNLILQNVLGTEYGGTGLSSLTENGILFASNSSSFSFATGTTGEVLQVNSEGIPVFDDLDGGEYS